MGNLEIALFCDARSIHFKKWIAALRERNLSLAVYSPWPDCEPREYSVKAMDTVRAPFPLPEMVKTAGKLFMRARNGRRLRQNIVNAKPKLLHAHYLTDSGWMAAHLDFHPFLVTIHGSDLLVHPGRQKLYYHAVKFILKRADGIVIVNENLRKPLLQLKVPETKIRLVTSFIDNDIFFPAKEPKENELIVIGSVRNFSEIYNVQTLIEAIPYLVQRRSKIKFILAGDGPLREELLRLAKRLSVNRYIQFTGSLNQTRLAEAYREMDIYVSTSLSDGLSVSLLEAAACSAFPVLADIAGNHQDQYGLDCLFFKPGDPIDLANKVVEAIKVGRDRATLEKNARIVSSLFGKKKVVDNMLSVYREFGL